MAEIYIFCFPIFFLNMSGISDSGVCLKCDLMLVKC